MYKAVIWRRRKNILHNNNLLNRLLNENMDNMIVLVKLNQLFVTTNNAKLQHKIGIQNKM